MPLPEEMNYEASELAKHANDADVAIVTIGRNSGEFLDRTTDDFVLSQANKRLVSDVARAFHAKGKKVIVIMNVGGVLQTSSWKDEPDAILCAWQGGQEGGNSVADVLCGKAYPSGKLSMTFPVAFADHASSANFPLDIKEEIKLGGSNDNIADPVRTYHYTPYEEDVFVGYRYFDSFDKPVSYPFGYGLSYTTFEYSNPVVRFDNGVYSVSVDVRNTGKRDGKEVVQLYVAAPDNKGANKPVKELKAFAKTSELKPGESEMVNMTFSPAELASFNGDTNEWVVDEGTYNLLIGASSRDIRHKLDIDVKGRKDKANPLFAVKTELNTLKR